MRRLRRHGDRDRESGMSTVEVVLLAPLVLTFVLVLVVFGELVNTRGTVQGAARDAARMGSLQRDDAAANSSAYNAAVADLGGTCNAGPANVAQVDPNTKGPSAEFVAGELYTVKVTCTVNWFGVSRTFVSYSTAPLDVFRRTN
jgi:Flp pilus assembly protein TadG